MRLLLLVVAAVLALCSVGVAGEKSATIPLFVWSDKSLFPKQNEQVLDTLTVQDIDDTLQALLFKTNSKNFIKATGNPDSIVLFVESQLQTDQIPHFGGAYAASSNGGAFSILKSIVESSKASLVAPYVTAGSQYSLLDSVLARIVRNLGEGSVLMIREEGSSLLSSVSRYHSVQSMSISDVKADTFANGVPALVIVCLDKAVNTAQFSSHGATVEAVNQAVSTATSGNFIAMYTGNSAETSTQWTFGSQQARSMSTYYSVVGDGYGNSTGNGTEPRTYLTGPILEAFMVLIALFTMLFVGLCNLCKLQVPEQFETPKVVKLAAI